MARGRLAGRRVLAASAIVIAALAVGGAFADASSTGPTGPADPTDAFADLPDRVGVGVPGGTEDGDPIGFVEKRYLSGDLPPREVIDTSTGQQMEAYPVHATDGTFVGYIVLGDVGGFVPSEVEGRVDVPEEELPGRSAGGGAPPTTGAPAP